MTMSPAIPLPPSVPARERWRQQRILHDAAESCSRGQEGAFWDRKENVNRFFASAGGSYRERIERQLASLVYPPGARVLDIGAGTGTLAVPLALRGCSVTAIEPSRAMAEMLREYQIQSRAPEIRIIPKKWEDVTERELDGTYDLVVASYSLTMPEIEDAVRKMDSACRGRTYLFWFLTQPPRVLAMQDLWRPVHGEEFFPEPMADLLWQVLYEMGIYANLAVEPGGPPHLYASLDEAVSDFRSRLSCTGREHDARIRSYLKDRLRPEGTGFLFGGGSFSATIWWEKK